MAIGYARAEFVKRSEGKTACGKAAYNSRSRIEFEGNCVLDAKVFDWSNKDDPEFHDVMLPEGVDENFKNTEVLWNAVERHEKKLNSQVAIDLVLALPDDEAISLDDRVELTQQFVQDELVSKGFGVQVDIHPPERRIIFTKASKELGISKGMGGVITSSRPDCLVVSVEKGGRSFKQVEFCPRDFDGYSIKEHNWHAHLLVTTRRFSENGKGFELRKPRDLMPQIRKGKVISGPDWGKQWTVHQNRFFEERGLSLRVDHNGIVPQEHLGPVRMRARAFALLEEHSRRLELNSIESEDPKRILEKITEKSSVFRKDDVDRFLQKYVSAQSVASVREAFWKQEGLVRLFNKTTGEVLDRFTSQKVLDEEKKILRLAERLNERKAFTVKAKSAEKCSGGLNAEQLRAFESIIQGRQLGLIQGYAGTGKSYLLSALSGAYEGSGVKVRAFGPDNATADVLREKGFKQSENVYRFLFALHNGHRKICNGKELWVLDEAGKLGNRPLMELLKEAEKRNVRLILSGDPKQLPSVERGGMFDSFCSRFGACVLEDIQRQKAEKQREISRNLAYGEVGRAIDGLCEVRGLKWSEDKKGAIEELIHRWASDRAHFPDDKQLIVAHSNAEVRVLNEMARIVLKQQGKLAEREFLCETFQGSIFLGAGDRVEFRKNDRELGVTNGLSGEVVSAEKDCFAVAVQDGKKRTRLISFDPKEYHAYQLGYASTFYRSQGRTVDRAYVLHNSHMSKEMFYVGLTRHTRQAEIFLSQDKVLTLSDLKRQMSRETKKTTTLEFCTAQGLEESQRLADREKAQKELKESDLVMDRLKGYGSFVLSGVSGQLGSIRQRFSDRRADRDFFSWKGEPSATQKASVHEVIPNKDKCDLILRELKEKPLATVVVVDSLKAAEEGEKKFPRQELVFVNWKGEGSEALDWRMLSGRKAIVWPSNNAGGFKEAEGVCVELKKACVKELYLMNNASLLSKLPKGWSLKDPFPEGVNEKMLNFYMPGELKNGLHIAAYRKFGIEGADFFGRLQLSQELGAWEGRVMTEHATKLNEALSENERQAVLNAHKEEAFAFLDKEKLIEQRLKIDPLICASGDLAKRLARQAMLFEAKNGRAPSVEETLQMKSVIEVLAKGSPSQDVARRVAFDQAVSKGCEMALQGKRLGRDEIGHLKDQVRRDADILREISIRNLALEPGRGLSQDHGNGIGYN